MSLRTTAIASLLLACLLLVPSVGCTSNEPTNVADAPQSEIDKYNQLIEEEAKRVSETEEDKDI